MHRESIMSTNLVSIGHHGTTLEIEYKAGPVVQYYGVSRKLFDEIRNAKSPGAVVWKELKKKGLPFQKVPSEGE